MDMQFELFGGAPELAGAKPIEHRYYFTLLPPPAVAQEIERGATLLGRRYGIRNVVRAERQHVSLHIVQRGREIATDLLDDALEVGEAVRRPGFDLAFDTVLTWADKRPKSGGRAQYPTVLTCSDGARDMLALYGDIRQQMQRLGLRVEPRSFEPHLTIWYGQERLAERQLRRAYRWPVRAFWLVHTVPGMRRPEYLAEWPLGG
ncbi:MAG: 2'-5' RNA ligase family protein [Devosia sp.]